jgi:hypothetical protein
LKGVRSLPFPLAILLVTFGLSGLYICYGKQARSLAKIALGIGMLGGAAGLVSIVWMAPGIDNRRSVMNGFMAFMFAGLFVFGLVALRVKPMSRGNVLPVLASFWWPLIVIQAYVFPLVTGRSGPQVPSWLSFAIFSLMSFFLALLGLVLQADARNRSASSAKMFF